MDKNEPIEAGKDKVVVLLSGGLDSTTLAYALKDRGYDVNALAVVYGQKHRKELRYCKKTCARLGIPLKVANIAKVQSLLAKGALTGSAAVPEENYDHASQKVTVVPNRNMIMISLAAAYAETIGASGVYYAAHNNDYTIYPDCRPEFVHALADAVQLATESRVRLKAPFVSINKSDIVTLGTKLNVPFAKCWSCYKGGKIHCGVCGTCRERKEAFKLAGVADPTKYSG